MLGAPIIAREVRLNSAGGESGSIGFPWKETSPWVTRVAATTELVLPCRLMAVLLIEFAATEQSGASSREESPTSTSVPLVPRARMQGLFKTSMTATALVLIVRLDRNIDASSVPWVCCKVTATPLLTVLSLYG